MNNKVNVHSLKCLKRDLYNTLLTHIHSMLYVSLENIRVALEWHCGWCHWWYWPTTMSQVYKTTKNHCKRKRKKVTCDIV